MKTKAKILKSIFIVLLLGALGYQAYNIVARYIHENAILIPRSAVIEDRAKNTRSVFIVKGDISERRDVELGLSQGSNVEIISGLSAGDMVVTAGQYSLKDNEKVMVVGQ